MKGEITNLENARGHDVWKTIGFSIASVGLSTVARFAPAPPANAPVPGLAAFGSGLSIQ